MKEPNIEFLESEIVKKGWGYERIIVNNQKYCGKILHFNKGAKFSMHYHLIKEETFYISYGKIILNYPNLANAKQLSVEKQQGDIIHIYPGQPHQIIALEETEVFEISTTHYDEDNYRIIPGDSQNNLNK